MRSNVETRYAAKSNDAPFIQWLSLLPSFDVELELVGIDAVKETEGTVEASRDIINNNKRINRQQFI